MQTDNELNFSEDWKAFLDRRHFPQDLQIWVNFIELAFNNKTKQAIPEASHKTKAMFIKTTGR